MHVQKSKNVDNSNDPHGYANDAHAWVRPVVQTDHLLLVGRLKSPISTWKVITGDPWVLNTIQGYQVDILLQSVQPHIPQYSVEQSQLIVEEVQELLGKGAIAVVENPQGGFYSNVFLVPKKDGGQRPVISFVHMEHFKMEGIHTLRDLVNPRDWLAKVDLKDAYFAIPIHKSHHKYLRFEYQQNTISSSAYHLACHQLLGSLPRP